MEDIIASERPIDKSFIKNWAQRDDYAKFIRKMRGKDFENPDIRKIVTESGGDIAEGKRSATSVARAAEMVADTKIKQEVLSDLDEMKLDKGPRWWKGDDKYKDIEGPMGADDRAGMTKRLNDKVYYGVMEDLDNLVGEEKSYEILKFVDKPRFNNDPDAFVQAIKEEIELMDDLDALVGEEKSYEILKFVDKKNYRTDPDAFIQALKQEIESSAIKYDMTFWENYVNEIMQLTTAEVPMFRTGGLV